MCAAVQAAAAANISSDQEECLYLLNLKLAEAVRPRRNEFGDQGFINEVYLWERLDLGLAHNTIVHLLQVPSTGQVLYLVRVCSRIPDI